MTKHIKNQRQCIGEAQLAVTAVCDGKKPDGYQMPYLRRMHKALERQ